MYHRFGSRKLQSWWIFTTAEKWENGEKAKIRGSGYAKMKCMMGKIGFLIETVFISAQNGIKTKMLHHALLHFSVL